MLTIVSSILALAPLAMGTVFTVEPDGSGDFPTIQVALVAAADGDEIVLGDGIFAGDGNRDIDFLGKAVTVRSLSGDPAACTIDCQGSEVDQHRGIIFQTDEGPDSVVDGITIMHGWLDSYGGHFGGGIYCVDDASPTIRNCVLYRNEAPYGGGMCGGAHSVIGECAFVENVSVRGGGAARMPNAELEDCAFVRNSATYGGGVYIRSSCSPTFTGCIFEDNAASHSGGALHMEQHCNPVFSHCTITGNSSQIGGAVDVSIECAPSFVSCTLHENSCTYTGSVSSYEYSLVTFENSIISFGTAGRAVSCYDSEVVLTCCDIYGNADGDWVGYVADQYGVSGNISEDPLFCLDENPDEPLALHGGSPCAPDHNPACGLIGAWDVACGVTPTEETSWGAVKASFTRR
jgi:hypothetical protein